MAGLVPQLSGSGSAPLESQLIWTERRGSWGLEQAIDPATLHEIGADQAGEGELAVHGLLRGLCEPQQQKGDESDGDLDANSIVGGSEEASDFQGLLDPPKEQLDGPAALVEVSDLLRAGVEIIGENTQNLAAIGRHTNLT